jgi:DNA recombination protein RmuC
MHDRLAVLGEHLARLGRSLENSVRSFNQAVGSFDSRILPSARKFTELGITSRKEVPEIDQIEQGTRELQTPVEPES